MAASADRQGAGPGLSGPSPLEGVRIVDLSRVLAGPFASQLLVQLGAEVIKVEEPGAGEEGRHMAPPVKGQHVYYNSNNRGKLGITLDLRRPAAAPVLLRLIERSDVLLESFRPGTLARMGFPFERLSSANPRLVLVSISGFGQSGPYARRPAFDQCAQAMSGVMALTGEPDGPPTRVGAFIGDHMAGVYAALGTLAALRQRDLSGRGLAVDVSMLDALLSTTLMDVVRHLAGYTPGRTGNAHPYVAPSNVYRAADGRYVFISAPSERLWTRLAGAMGRPDLVSDPAFAASRARQARRAETDAIVAGWVSARPAAAVVEALDRAEVPCAPVLDIGEVAEDPHLWERGLIEWREHPIDGRVALVGSPLKLSGSPPRDLGFPPHLGEHNRDVYCGLLGMSGEEVERLRAAGAI